MGQTEESVRRSARVLTGFMSQAEAERVAASLVIDPPSFMAAYQAQAAAHSGAARDYTPPRIEDLPSSMDLHVASIRMDPRFPAIYGHNAEFKMVELGKLLAFQHLVDTDVSDGVHGAGVQMLPDLGDILKRCLPLEIVSVAQTRWINNEKSFSVCTMDNSFDLVGVNINPVSGQILFTVGSGANLMLVREQAGRYLLANGYHRAWLLRSRGVEMVPVVVVKMPPQVEAVPAGGVPANVVMGPRPPIIDDFFDDHRSVSVAVRSTMTIVKITAERSVVPRLL